MLEGNEKPHNHRFLAQVEADLVLVDRDLALIDTKLRKLSDDFYRAMGRDGTDQVNQEYQFYQQRKLNLQAEKKRLDEELATFEVGQGKETRL